MKAKQLREESVDHLKQQVIDLQKQGFRLRMQKSMGQLGETHRIRELRRDIARIKTVLRQKKVEA